MENNKTYLQRIHFAAIIAIAGYFLIRFLVRQAAELNLVRYIADIASMLPVILSFAALGLVTNKWKAAIIAAAIALGIYIINHWIIPPEMRAGNIYRLLIFFVEILPMTFFVLFASGTSNRVPVIFVLCLLADLALGFGQYSNGLALDRTLGFRQSVSFRDYVSFACSVGTFVTHVIFICEIINFANGKATIRNSRLINLGNVYGKPNSLLTFWSIKSALWYLVSSTMLGLYAYMENFQAAALHRSSSNGILDLIEDFSTNTVSPYYYITAGIVMAAYIITGLLLGWYLRKFLLEVFFTYDIKSKFIYWLSFVPLLGFLFVLFTVGPAKQQQLYIEKRSSLVQFAESNSSSVVTAFMVLLVIRLLLTLSDGDAISIIFLLVTGVLFFWMSADKTGFYAYFFINLLLLVSGILMMYFSKKPADLVGAMTGLVLLGTIQLIFVFPIFHFGEFEFIPAEEPAEEAHNTDGEFHLFPAMK